MAGFALVRQTPCWRANTPQLTAPFTPETGISVLCSINADNVFDTAGIPRYDWYLVADATHPGRTLGWTPAWPFTAPAQAVPTCGAPFHAGPSPLTIVAAALAFVALVFLVVAIWWRLSRKTP